jgi:transposase-like protein
MFMQPIENTKRPYYSKAKKIQILNELNDGGITHTELARRHGIHPVTLFKWKREMTTSDDSEPEKQPDYQELLRELESLKKENNHLKKAIGEIAVEKLILKTANDIYRRESLKKKFLLQKKSSKK